MIYPPCPSCGLATGAVAPSSSVSQSFCKCNPYIPVMDRGYPDTEETEIQQLTDLVASQAREIAALKRAAQEQALQSLSDMAQADDALAAKDAEIAKLQTGHDLYEVVRRMSVPQFRDVYVLNCDTSEPFDEIVAGMAHEFGLTVRKG